MASCLNMFPSRSNKIKKKSQRIVLTNRSINYYNRSQFINKNKPLLRRKVKILNYSLTELIPQKDLLYQVVYSE